MPAKGSRKFLLPIIVFAQFAGTSLWFTGNAILSDLNHSASGLSNITSIVQFGFIAGTLIFSLAGIADRYSAPRIFLFSSIIASSANLLLIFTTNDIIWLYVFRFITGFFLAGIYPVGMKIAADCFPNKLGNALGFLVGALVLGTAFPHVMKTELKSFHWEDVLLVTSALAVKGGILIALLVPATQYTSKKTFSLSAAFSDFGNRNFRAAAFGYFGHMWELYALWAFIPQLIRIFNQQNTSLVDVSLWSFIIIGAGCAGCIIGGILSRRIGSKKVAMYAMMISASCCLLLPFLIQSTEILFLALMVLWGVGVVADSPQFSTLVATSAGLTNKGTALTIVTCIGFSITILSIQLMKPAMDIMGRFVSLILLPGPVFGILALRKYLPVFHRQVHSKSN